MACRTLSQPTFIVRLRAPRPVGVTLFSGVPATENGVLVQGPLSGVNPGNACGWTSLDDMIMEMQIGGTYVNVHTLSNLPGEVRGQL